jgi:hypothetical protein
MLNEGACNFCNIHLSWITTSWRKLAFDISGKSAPLLVYPGMVCSRFR